MIKIVLLSVIILAICFLLMSIKVIFIKGGRFPNTHVDGNPALRKKGLSCHRAQDAEARLHKTLDELKKEM